MDLRQIKQRFSIIGNSVGLNRALDIAMQVAPSDLSVLITGESGTGKETVPQIIHHLSARKHNTYIAVNCGAIPEGTIDSELFGHVKGAFTGATSSRKGYFEAADKGTIFLDEIGDLPTPTQARLLRVLEAGEYIPVGSSEVKKTDVRVVAATNIDIQKSIKEGKFREDLLYRLNTVPVAMTPLRDRGRDILLLFKKFTLDITEKYGIPAPEPTEEAEQILMKYRWPGNIRQLKNIAEQISIIEEDRTITAEQIKEYLPSSATSNLPAVIEQGVDREEFSNEREILYKVLFDMRSEINEMKYIIKNISKDNDNIRVSDSMTMPDDESDFMYSKKTEHEDFLRREKQKFDRKEGKIEDTEEIIEESLSLKDKEIELIKKALKKYSGKRKNAAGELGISERTLYRKIKEYDIE
ncbi:MAG: sigma-54 dependent transcriptional regulator [Bacteroidota bacterium]|nr:sigma-54 dependent transcriptional regulator [Bacteroidota bacterium]